MTSKEIYCVARAEELNRTFGYSFKQAYEKAEAEWKKQHRTARWDSDGEYDDEIEYPA